MEEGVRRSLLIDERSGSVNRRCCDSYVQAVGYHQFML